MGFFGRVGGAFTIYFVNTHFPLKLPLRLWLEVGVFVVLIAICYHRVAPAPFIWDDHFLVESNSAITDNSPWFTAFTKSSFGEDVSVGRFYRPMQTLSYKIEYSFWGLNPTGYRITNIVLHLLNTCLVFYLLIRLKVARLLAFGIGVVFAVHPIQIENVSYIAARADVLYLVLCLLVFHFFLTGCRQHWFGYVVAVFLYILALLTKESSVALAPILFVYAVLYGKEIKSFPDALGVSVLLTVLAVIYAVFRVVVLTPVTAAAKVDENGRFENGCVF